MVRKATIARTLCGMSVGIGTYYLFAGITNVYTNHLMEPVTKASFPLGGIGAGISQAFATAPEVRRNRLGWKHYVGGLTLGTLIGASTSFWRMANKADQFDPARLQGQAPVAQLLEDIASVGVTLGAMYAITAIGMNLYEFWQKKQQMLHGIKNANKTNRYEENVLHKD